MTISPAERRARASLPLMRFFQSYMPFNLARWVNRQGLTQVTLPAGVTRQTVSTDGVRGEWIIPDGSPADSVLLYLHGGGFVFELSPLHLQMLALLAHQLNRRVLAVDYRVAPDHPFPAALDDCLTAYRWLLKQGIAPKQIVVAGDSAGGNLTITMMMALRDRGEGLPAAGACLSPAGDLSARENTTDLVNDPLLPPRAIRRYTASYVGNSDARTPLISPVFGDWRGLPPLLIHVGEDEILREDAVRMEALAREAGVSVRLEVYPRMWHVWQLFPALPQAVASLDDIARFLKSHLNQAHGIGMV